MIKHHPIKTLGIALGIAIVITLLSGTYIRPANAETPTEASPDEHSADKANALKAMEGWLKLNDEGKYEEAWKEAAPIFKTTLTAAQWSAAAQQARAPLGKTVERKVASAFYTTTMPSPKGPITGIWVVAQFQTRFANLYSAIETVTFQKDDGVWRASGYYIKPAI